MNQQVDDDMSCKYARLKYALDSVPPLCNTECLASLIE